MTKDEVSCHPAINGISNLTRRSRILRGPKTISITIYQFKKIPILPNNWPPISIYRAAATDTKSSLTYIREPRVGLEKVYLWPKGGQRPSSYITKTVNRLKLELISTASMVDGGWRSCFKLHRAASGRAYSINKAYRVIICAQTGINWVKTESKEK